MPRRSRRQSSPSVGKSRASFNPSNVRSTRVDTRFEYFPVERRKFLDEGNKALRALLARDLGYQRAGSLAERPARIPPGRPGRVFAPVRDAGKSFLTKTLPVFTSTFDKVRHAVICAKRQVRRELVFASGGAGSKKPVGDRRSPSKVRC